LIEFLCDKIKIARKWISLQSRI